MAYANSMLAVLYAALEAWDLSASSEPLGLQERRKVQAA